MGNAMCCSERPDNNQSINQQKFSLDESKRKKIMAANSHYNGTTQDDDGRLSTLNPTPTLQSQSPTPNGQDRQDKNLFTNENTDQRVSEFKLETVSTEQTEQSLQWNGYENTRHEKDKKSEFLSARRDDPLYVENSPNAILGYFQDNRRFLIDRIDGDAFEFSQKEYVFLGSYSRETYEVNQYYSIQTNSVVIEKKFRDVKDLRNEVDSSKSFKCCKNLKVFISNMLSVHEEECKIYYEMGSFRLKDIMRKNLLTEEQLMKIVLNLVEFILLSHSNEVTLKEIQQDQVSLSLSSSNSASGASLNRYFVQLNNFLEMNETQQHTWQVQVQHVSDIFSEYSESRNFIKSCSLLTFIESTNEETNMVEFLNHLRDNYDELMKDTLVNLSEEQVNTLKNIYLTEQCIETNFEFFQNLFYNGASSNSNTVLTTEQHGAIVNKLNSYIFSNFKNKSKHGFVERCIILFEEQSKYENLYELEIIYRIYHALLCFLNLKTDQSIKQLIKGLKLCKNPNIILLYQSLIYAFLSLAYIQKQDIPQAKNLFIYSNRIYQSNHKNTTHFPRNNFYQILIFAQSIITYRLSYFETSIKRLDYLEKVGAKSKLLIEQKYILFMKGMNKMELDQYSEAEQYFEKTLNLVTNEETRQSSITDFQKANSDATVDKNIFDILIMNILANSWNKNSDKLESNVEIYQNYNSDYANDNKSVQQVLNKILSVILC